MRETHHEAPWCGFPKTLLEFEERFETEEPVARTLPCAAGTDGRVVIAATAITSGQSAAARFTNAPAAATRQA